MFNDLLVKLEEAGIEVFACADDLAAHAFDLDKLSEAIQLVEKWAEDNNMKINRKKSGILFHKKRKSKRNDGE